MEELGGRSADPVAGWYDDPLTPGAQRYWDGTAWTEAVHGPNPATAPGASVGGPPPMIATGPIGDGAPPFEPLPPGAHAVGLPDGFGGFGGQSPPGTTAGGSKVNDLGEWLSRTFTVIFANWQPVAVLTLLPLPLWGTGVWLAHRTASQLRWTVDDGDLDGLSVPLVIATSVMMLLAAVASLVTYVGAHHFLFGAHIGRPVTWARSLLVGLIRLPRFLVLAILVQTLVVLVLAAPVGLFVIGLVQDDGVSAGLVVLSLLLMLAAVLFLIWFWVKAVAFLPVAAAVVPRGTSAMGAAWRVSSGRFWPILARVAILFAVTSVISTVAQTIAQTMAPTLLFSRFELTVDNRLFINGRDIDTIDVLELSEVLPSPAALVGYIVAIVAVSALSQMVSASALTALYGDVRSPNSFDH